VEPRLTAILQLRPLPQSSRALGRPASPSERASSGAEAPTSTRVAEHGPGGASIEGSSVPGSRRRCCRPLDGLATRPLTPSCALGGCGWPGQRLRTGRDDRIPIASGRWPALGAVSSKTTFRTVPGRLPSSSAPSPEHASRGCAWDHGEPATGIAARALVAFATATRLPTRFRLLISPARAGGDGPARPGPCGPHRAPLDDFCNQLDPRAPPKAARSPPRYQGWPSRSRGLPASNGARTKRASPETLPPSSTGGAVSTANETEVRSWTGDSNQPSFHEPGRHVRPGPRPRPTAARALSSVVSRLCPTRSIRTPLVVRSSTRRLETPALRPSHLTLPALEGRGRGPFALGSRVAYADTTGAGAEGRFPCSSAKKSRLHEPEVPSTSEPATTAATRPEPHRERPERDELAWDRGQGFPQDVASLWKTHDAF